MAFTITPPRQPPRPSLSALKIDQLPDHEATEQLRASPSFQFTPLSTPISSAKSETQAKLWKKMQADGSIPIGQIRPGMHHSASFTAVPTRHCEMQAEILPVTEVDMRAKDSNHAQTHLHTLIKSISQQDIKSELATWRQEVNRASHQRIRKTSESSIGKFCLEERQQRVPSSPDSLQSRHSAQLRQVSAIAIKAKASGWKITKGSNTPIRFGNSKSACAERTCFESDSPSRIRGRDVGKSSKTSATTSTTSENKTYVPSELEKLIFGNGSQSDNHSSSSLTLSQTCQVQQRIVANVEPLQGDEEEEFVDHDASSTSMDHHSTCSSSRSEGIASYKAKGRAAALRLNLSGRSNLHSESMKATTTFTSSAALQQVPIKSSQRVRSVQIHTAISNDDSTVDPDMSIYSAHSPSSVASNQSPFKYSTNDTAQRNTTPSVLANENNTRAETGHLHYLTVDSSVQGDSGDEVGAIEKEVQLWKERRL